MKPPHLFEYVAAAILHEAESRPNSALYTVNDAASFTRSLRYIYSADLPEPLVEESLEYLTLHKAAVKITDEFTKPYVWLDKDSVHDVYERLATLPNSAYQKSSRLGKPWITEALKNVSKHLDGQYEFVSIYQENEIPTSDGFVTIDHNSQTYTEVSNSLEDASEEIRGSNSLDPEKKHWIKLHLDAGIDLLKKGPALLRSALRSLILQPLEAAFKEVGEEKAKSAIRLAITLIRQLLS